MGHGASSRKLNGKSPFDSKVMEAACKVMTSDPDLRLACSDYVKSGLWIEKLTQCDFVEEENGGVSSKKTTASTDSFVSSTKSQSTKAHEAVTASSKTAASLLRTISKVNTIPSGKTDGVIDTYGGAYMSIDTENTFAPEDLCSLVLYAAVPNFLSSKFHHGSGCSNLLSSSSDSNDDDMARKICSTQPSSLAQELFTSCAANFEEDDMAALLHKGDWYQRVSESLKEHELGITVFDLNRDACPIVYANKAFQQLTGYSEGELLGKGYLSLYPYNQHTWSRSSGAVSSSAVVDNVTVIKKEQQRSQVHEKLLQIDSLASHPLKKKNGRAATHVNAYRLVPTPPPPAASCSPSSSSSSSSSPRAPLFAALSFASSTAGTPKARGRHGLHESQPQQQQLVVGVHYSTEACGMGPVDSSILSQMDELIALLPYLVQPPDVPSAPRPPAPLLRSIGSRTSSLLGAATAGPQQQGEKLEFSPTTAPSSPDDFELRASSSHHHPGKKYRYLYKGERGEDETPTYSDVEE